MADYARSWAERVGPIPLAHRCFQAPQFDLRKSGMSLKREPESPDDIAEANIQAALREQAGEIEFVWIGLTSLPESLGKLTSLGFFAYPRKKAKTPNRNGQHFGSRGDLGGS